MQVCHMSTFNVNFFIFYFFFDFSVFSDFLKLTGLKQGWDVPPDPVISVMVVVSSDTWGDGTCTYDCTTTLQLLVGAGDVRVMLLLLRWAGSSTSCRKATADAVL